MEETRRIVLLGKTGAGKSSLANTIFGKNVFKINHTLNSETKKCRRKTKSVNGRNVELIDTPGFFDTHMSEAKLKTEMVRCITKCAHGPHAFLIMLKVEKFTKQEKAIIGKICEYFSEEALKHAAVVFTHGDQLPEGTKIEEFVQKDKDLSDLVKKCGGRCHIVDNKHWNNSRPDEYRSNQFQVAELLNTIDKIVEENNGGCYTNAMLQTVEKMRKRTVLKFLKKLVCITTEMLLEAFLGVSAMIILVVTVLMTMKPSTAAVVVEAQMAATRVAAAIALGLPVGGFAAAKSVREKVQTLKKIQNSKTQQQSEEKEPLLTDS